MYANPKLAEPLKKKLNKIVAKMAKTTQGSQKWNDLGKLYNEILSQWGIIRLKKDPLALTYKDASNGQ